MTEKSNIRALHGQAATFVEDRRDGKVVVTTDGHRTEIDAVEWEQLADFDDTPPHDFDKTASDVGEA